MKIFKRGCGYPLKGKIYISISSQEGKFAGSPADNFLICPTMPIVEEFNIAAQGVQVRPRFSMGPKGLEQAFNKDGVPIYDLWDWIGGVQYPNVLDWFIEAKELGFHQLVQRNLQWDLLVKESCYFGIHPRAHIANIPIVWLHYHAFSCEMESCPKKIVEHDQMSEQWLLETYHTCQRMFKISMIEGNRGSDNYMYHAMPSFSWRGLKAPDGIEWASAAFIKLPIGQIAEFIVYFDDEQQTHELALKELEKLDQSLQRIKIVEI